MNQQQHQDCLVFGERVSQDLISSPLPEPGQLLLTNLADKKLKLWGRTVLAPFITPGKAKLKQEPRVLAPPITPCHMASDYFVLFPSTLCYFKSTSDTSNLRVSHGSKSTTSTFSCSYFLIHLLVFKLIPALGGILEVLYVICPVKTFTWFPLKQ